MAKPTSLLEDARAFARDFPRERMPAGYMWDLVDYVPALLDAQLTGRGGWKWGSALGTTDFQGGIYAPFTTGDRLLLVGGDSRMYGVDPSTGALTDHCAVHPVRQNPVMHRDFVIVPHKDGTSPAYCVQATASAVTSTLLPSGDPNGISLPGKYATVYKDLTILGNAPGKETQVQFSPPGDPLGTGTIKWDPDSIWNTSLPLTGLGALRAVILLFHNGSVERLRGTEPPHGEEEGDMFLENLYDRAGCGDARTIAYWQDNCIFADERGIHLTDGAIVRNLASQGGILSYWRTLYRERATVAADTFLDYYVITVIRTDNVAVTLVCDLQRRSWFRFTNLRSVNYIHSIGAQEKLWGCRQGAQRLVELSNVFFPTPGQTIDDDGTPVLPSFETPWYRLSEEGRKRVRFAYLSYDVRASGALTRIGEDEEYSDVGMGWRGAPDSNGQVLESFEEEAVMQAEQADAKAHLQALELGYITSPHETNYTVAGHLPETTKYTRHRLPVGKNPYGIAFRVKQLAPSYVTRVYDLQAEAQPNERSRL